MSAKASDSVSVRLPCRLRATISVLDASGSRIVAYRDDCASDAARFHKWMADAVLPAATGTRTSDVENAPPWPALLKLHKTAAEGFPITIAQWRDVLGPVYHALFVAAFPYDQGYAKAYASALEFAGTNRKMIEDAFGSAEAYAQYYGDTNTTAIRDFGCRAHAAAHTRLAAPAYASCDLGRICGSGLPMRLRALLFSVAVEDRPQLSSRLLGGLLEAFSTRPDQLAQNSGTIR